MAKLVFSQQVTSSAPMVLPGGRFFRLMDTAAVVDVEFFAKGASIAKAEGVLEGFGLKIDDPADIGSREKLVGFDQVKITSSTTQTVQAAVSRYPIDYDRQAGEVDATLTKGATLTQSSVTVSSTSIALLAANANRRRAHVQNTSQTETVYICDDGTTATTSHYPLGPSEVITIESTDGINAIRGGTTDAVVRIFEERD